MTISSKPEASMPSQSMKGITSGGGVKQSSDVTSIQSMDEIKAEGSVEQIINGATGGLRAIADELEKLKNELKADDPSATLAIVAIENAREAALDGDRAGVASNLKGLGKWIVDFATKVGSTVVAKIITAQMDLGS